MKKILVTLAIVFAWVLSGNAQCNDQLLNMAVNQLSEDFSYVKDVKVRLKKSKKNKAPYSIKQSFIMNKDQTYKIYVRNANEFDGRLIFQLSNVMGVLATSYKNGKHYKGITYKCNKTGMYYLSAFFEDGLEGCSVIVISTKATKHEIEDYLSD